MRTNGRRLTAILMLAGGVLVQVNAAWGQDDSSKGVSFSNRTAPRPMLSGEFRRLQGVDTQLADGLLPSRGSFCSSNGIFEGENNCGLPDDFINGGCNSNPPVFIPIGCGDTICGTAAFDTLSGLRDTDWFEIVLSTDTRLTWRVTAGFDLVIGVIDNGGIPDCTGVDSFLVFDVANPSRTAQVSTCVPAGTWWLFVAPDFTDPVFCGAPYEATLVSCEPCDASSCIPPGDDCWSTACGGSTVADFSDNPIPAGFFEPGSQPFDGAIELGGATGFVDTVMRRHEPMCFDDVLPSTQQTAIELTQLDLASCRPITVGGSGDWDVQVTLGGPQPLGLMEVTKTSPNGGFFIADFAVQPVYIFSRVGNPTDQRIFNTAQEGLTPIQMQTDQPVPWSTDETFDFCSTDGFAPGVTTDEFGQPCCEETCHSSFGSAPHQHCVSPPECPQCTVNSGAIPAGPDLFGTVSDVSTDGTPTTFDNFSANPIPGDFFGPDCQPFDGIIAFEGRPFDLSASGTADTRVMRLADMDLPNVGSVAATPIQIVALQLRSVDPILITCPSSPCGEKWNVFVDVNPADQPIGSMIVTKTHENGGTYDAQLPVLPRLTFVKQSDPSQIRVLDTAQEGLPPIDFFTANAPWVHTADPAVNVVGVGNSNFVPGVSEVAGQQTKELTTEESLLAAHGILPPCPPPPCSSPPPVSCWDDNMCGTWTDALTANLADLDGDNDVDENDHSIFVAFMGGPGRVLIERTEDDLGLPENLPDFTGDHDSDLEDWAYMQTQFTGNIAPREFVVSGDGLGATWSGESQLSYRLDAQQFLINGRLDDANDPDLQWEFINYGADYEFLNREELTAPTSISDPSVQNKMFAHGMTAIDIFQITSLLGPTALVTDVYDSMVDLTQTTVGTLQIYCEDVLQENVDTTGLTQGGFSIAGVLLEDGRQVTVCRWLDCPGCHVRITNCPVCVCKGCSYTFKASGLWVGGTYSWQVTNGADKTNPDSGSGASFTTTFIDKSAAKKDITIEVTYTAPNGDQCTAECKVTSVALDVVFDNPPDLTTPACGAEGAATNPTAGGSRYKMGGDAGKIVGVNDTVKNVQIKTDPQCDDCCETIKVGFIQNYTSMNLKATYQTADLTAFIANSADCNGGTLPLLDTAGADHPWYPYPAGKTTKCGVKCDVKFDLSIVDTPSWTLRLCRSGKKLTKVERNDTLRTWLVAECPKGSKNYKCFRQWDWKVEYDVVIPQATNNCTNAALTINKACATNTFNGACDAADWTARKTTGGTFNNCVRVQPNGF